MCVPPTDSCHTADMPTRYSACFLYWRQNIEVAAKKNLNRMTIILRLSFFFFFKKKKDSPFTPNPTARSGRRSAARKGPFSDDEDDTLTTPQPHTWHASERPDGWVS